MARTISATSATRQFSSPTARAPLSCMGWQYAEPVLRSLAYALQDRGGDGPPDGDAAADRPWKQNSELAKQIRPDWQEGKLEDSATSELLAALRTSSETEVPQQVVALLNRGVAPQINLGCPNGGAGELFARAPGIVALDAMTSSNACDSPTRQATTTTPAA